MWFPHICVCVTKHQIQMWSSYLRFIFVWSSFRFTVESLRFFMSWNNERGLTERDVLALCDVNASAKRHKDRIRKNGIRATIRIYKDQHRTWKEYKRTKRNSAKGTWNEAQWNNDCRFFSSRWLLKMWREYCDLHGGISSHESHGMDGTLLSHFQI